MSDLVNLTVGNAALIALTGYMVDFLGIVLLMCVILVMANVFISKKKAADAAAAAEKAVVAEKAPAAEAPKAPAAPGTAGDIKLYDTDPKDAAMIMAIVADTLGKPLNELRFKSIKEVK